MELVPRYTVHGTALQLGGSKPSPDDPTNHPKLEEDIDCRPTSIGMRITVPRAAV